MSHMFGKGTGILDTVRSNGQPTRMGYSRDARRTRMA